ncbi:CMD domain-containing protein [Mixta mediterraneensis]|uniref:CMD domain-containing protein n=1 Tax=Mixta mediterraneensis TaxID=2758443 RepID=UPI0018740E18|nr:oxidoreductase [Mixta mediterraneensis]MBE5251779.1 oxidoreductase [Mixta mediterraneensis]
MEQRRYPGHNHWFYESQTSPRTSQAAPLVPEAAHINDRFLLGLQQEAHALQSLLHVNQPALLAARDLSQVLFPASLTPTLSHTLTLYDRLSTALTVAQVAGVQRLCNHYSARLNPLPGPDSSRESNNRLTQITQYARQLAMQPELINAASITALDVVGLSEPDIVTLNQLIGFVCYQARVVAGLHALHGSPVRWLPGIPLPPDAGSAGFGQAQRWQPTLKPLELRYASAEQLAAITLCQPYHELTEAKWLLAHDPAALYGWIILRQRLETQQFNQLAQAACARILGSRWAFQHFPQAEALIASVDEAVSDEEQRQIVTLAAQLTRVPERFSAAQLQPLMNRGWKMETLFALIQSVALSNWNSRLYYALGEAR